MWNVPKVVSKWVVPEPIVTNEPDYDDSFFSEQEDADINYIAVRDIKEEYEIVTQSCADYDSWYEVLENIEDDRPKYLRVDYVIYRLKEER